MESVDPTSLAEEMREEMRAARAQGQNVSPDLPWIASEDIRAECGVFNPLNPVWIVMGWVQPRGFPSALMCLGVRTSEESAHRLCERILKDEGELRQFFVMRAGAWTEFPPRCAPEDFHATDPGVQDILRAALEQEHAAARELREIEGRQAAEP